MDITVPLIDLSSPEAAGEVDAACRSLGFFQIRGHGVPDSVVSEFRAAIDAFFALPMEVKLGCRATSPDANRGYTAKGTESAGYSIGVETPPDLFEAFNMGHDRPAPAGLEPALAGLYAPDVWPTELPAFRRAMRTYFEHLVPLAGRLLDTFALALDLPAGWFAERTAGAPDTLRVNQYERRPDSPEPDPGALGMGPHTDYGVVTILLADRLPGLEVAGQDGSWCPVVAEEGAFIVNVGDLLAQWTNDVWQSSLHRVVPPLADPDRPVVRRSTPFFKEAHPDTVVECLASCTSPERPARYPPVRAGEHLMAKLLGPRLGRTADTVSTVGSRGSTTG